MNQHGLWAALLVFGLASGVSSSAGAEVEAAGDALTRYRGESLHTRFAVLSGLRLFRGDQKVDLGYFGGNAGQIFGSSPDALASMRSFRTVRIVGVGLYAAGLAALIVDMVLVIAESSVVLEDPGFGTRDIKPPFWVLLGAGAAVGLTGGVMMQLANSYLDDAVGHFNRDLYRRLSGGQARRAFVVGWRGRF